MISKERVRNALQRKPCDRVPAHFTATAYLRTHDDYGSQRSMLFSVPMWKEYFEAHTRDLVNLAHE